MQTTDILGVTLSALANARAVSPSIDDRLQLNLAAHNDAYAPVEFVAAAGNTLTFPEFLAHHAAATSFGLARVEPVQAAPVSATVAAGFEGASPIAFAVESPDQVDLYAPILYFPPETTLTAAKIAAFLAPRASCASIAARIPLDPAVPGPIPAETQHALSLAFSHEDVAPADRHAWHELVQRHRVRLPARFVFRYQGSVPGAALDRPDLAACFTEVRDALHALAAYAERTEQRDWAGHFRGSAAQLSLAPDPQPIYGVLAECRVPPAAIRLLDAAQRAWVFGGMGSWNDTPTAGTDEHERLSAALLEALRTVLLAVANGPRG